MPPGFAQVTEAGSFLSVSSICMFQSTPLQVLQNLDSKLAFYRWELNFLKKNGEVMTSAQLRIRSKRQQQLWEQVHMLIMERDIANFQLALAAQVQSSRLDLYVLAASPFIFGMHACAGHESGSV